MADQDPAAPTPKPPDPSPSGHRQADVLEMPKHDEATVTCPSGLKVRVEEMDIDTMDTLMDPALARSGQTVTRVVEVCTLGVEDPGPYTLQPNGKLNWNNVAQVDLMKVLVEIRRITLGDGYDFSLKCPQKVCGNQFTWGLEIPELEERPMQPEGIASIQTGEPMQFHLPKTNRLLYHTILTTIEAVAIGAPFQSADEKQWNRKAIAKRVKAIDRVPDQDKSRWLGRVPRLDHLDLTDEIDRLEGGLELGFEIYCPKCETSIKVSLANANDFLLERSRTKRPSKTSDNGSPDSSGSAVEAEQD